MNREQDNQNEQECTLDEVLMELDRILNEYGGREFSGGDLRSIIKELIC